jgi:hypothetical protein
MSFFLINSPFATGKFFPLAAFSVLVSSIWCNTVYQVLKSPAAILLIVVMLITVIIFGCFSARHQGLETMVGALMGVTFAGGFTALLCVHLAFNVLFRLYVCCVFSIFASMNFWLKDLTEGHLFVFYMATLFCAWNQLSSSAPRS